MDFVFESTKWMKRFKQEKPLRMQIIRDGIRQGKHPYEIIPAMRKAGLLHDEHWVRRWVNYYKWKMQEAGEEFPRPLKRSI